jgi:hypothetical protein
MHAVKKNEKQSLCSLRYWFPPRLLKLTASPESLFSGRVDV